MARFALLFVAASLVSSGAFGAEIYKCTGANGRTEYRDTPCANGRGAQIDIADTYNSNAEANLAAVRKEAAAMTERLNATAAASAKAAREDAALAEVYYNPPTLTLIPVYVPYAARYPRQKIKVEIKTKPAAPAALRGAPRPQPLPVRNGNVPRPRSLSGLG